MLGLYLALIDSDEDKEKFTRIYEAYRHLMFYYAFNVLKDDFLAEDAVQEAFLRIAKNFRKVKDADSPQIKRFVVIVVRNLALSMLRKNERTENLDAYMAINEAAPEDSVFDEVSAKQLESFILKLPAAYRDVLYLYAVYGYSFGEIANLFSLTGAAVKKRAQRARNMLKEMCGEESLRNER